VGKAIRILELLASSEKPLTLTQISDELSLAKSTAHGLLRELVAATFLELHEPAAYSIGLRTFEVGAAYLRRTGAVGVSVSMVQPARAIRPVPSAVADSNAPVG